MRLKSELPAALKYEAVIIESAAREAGRPLREVERSGHALDHPVGFPEGAYLKCLFSR